jgi:hypothetical protein
MRALRRLYREIGEHDYVFVSERGGPMAREAFQRLVERAGKAAECRQPLSQFGRGLVSRLWPAYSGRVQRQPNEKAPGRGTGALV